MLSDLQLSLMGVPTNSAGRKGGVANAPAALRNAGLLDALDRFCRVRDEGDVPFSKLTTERDSESGIIAYASLASMIQGVKAGVCRALREGRFPLVIGGDCPVLLGCLAASAKAHPTGLLFVDGHEDAYPARQSPTGEAADMELGFALGLGVPELVRKAAGPTPLVDPSKIVMLGPRDKKVLQKTGVRSLDDGSIKFYNDKALLRGNIEVLVRRVVRQLSPNKLWLHVDLDVLSTRSMPAVDYPQPGGLSWSQLERLTGEILSSGNIAGMNVTIYNPDKDPGGRHAARIVRYLQAALAKR